jgi:hypothetical protein
VGGHTGSAAAAPLPCVCSGSQLTIKPVTPKPWNAICLATADLLSFLAEHSIEKPDEAVKKYGLAVGAPGKPDGFFGAR